MCEEDLDDKGWQRRYHKTIDAFWNNMMFWLFICYPNVSLICMQTFVCKRIDTSTFLAADYRGSPCPWGGTDLELTKFDTWQPIAWVSFAYILIYPVGVPVLMYIIMRHQGIPEMAMRKKNASLLTSLINLFSEETTTASSQRLASFVGMPPSLSNRINFEESAHSEGKEDSIQDHEVDRRILELYTNIFPEHAQCVEGCSGHCLPAIPATLLTVLGVPSDVASLSLKARHWFGKIDITGEKCLQLWELQVTS